MGRPCVFVRLAGCVEPYCTWCDTAYALDGGRETSSAEIIRDIESIGCSNIVITGGEPFMQRDEVLILHKALIKAGYNVQYETSGKAGIPELRKAMIVLSPKRPEKKWLIDKNDLTRAHYLKFVYDTESTGKAIRRFVKDNGIDTSRVYVMPQGRTKEAQMGLMPEVFEFCVKNGFTMTPRLHILCYGEKRGI